MKHHAPTILSQPFAGFLRAPGARAWRVGSAPGRGGALAAALALCLLPGRAADPAPSAVAPASPAAGQAPEYVPQGRQMLRYQAFVRQAQLPPVTVTGKTNLAVGGKVSLKLDGPGLASLSTRQAEDLAQQFAVPPELVRAVAQRLASPAGRDAAEFPGELRTAVIDYRFLLGEWDRYHPPAEGQAVKTEALQALQSGDVNRAWQLYDGLRRPQAPTALRLQAPTGTGVVSRP
jgi:hypothetical protein